MDERAGDGGYVVELIGMQEGFEENVFLAVATGAIRRRPL